MKPGLRSVGTVAVLLVVGAIAWWVWSPRAQDRPVLSGYVEGDDLYLSTPVAGSVGAVFVTKGQRVASGAALFAMDRATLVAQQAQASARLDQGRAQIASAEAQARQAQESAVAARATEGNARRDLDRLAGLQASNPRAVAAQQVDQARALAESAAAQRLAADAAAAAATGQAKAARAGAGQAAGSLQEAGVRLDQLAQRAPSGGRVEEVFYQSGEWAGANQPVVALLPDDRIKLRFFVPGR